MSEPSIPGSMTVSPFEAAASANGSRKNVGKLSCVTAILLPSGDQVGLMSHRHRSSLIWRVAAVMVTPVAGSSTLQSGGVSLCVGDPPGAGGPEGVLFCVDVPSAPLPGLARGSLTSPIF